MEQHGDCMGTRSTFGPQVSSKRQTSPTAKFGSGGRTSRIHEASFQAQLLGRTSPGPTTCLASGFGKQASSRCTSAPAYRVSKPAPAKRDKDSPGPGAYGVQADTIGVQPAESGCARSPAFKLGTSSRWSEFKNGPTGEPTQPLLTNARPPTGFLGDAPVWSFHGPKQRASLLTAGEGCPLAPTSIATPGPGAYQTETSAFGTQVNSEATSSIALKVPRSSRDALMKQALPRGQEYVLLGRASPGPGVMGQCSSMGKQLLSNAKSDTGLKFSTSDRFREFNQKTTVNSQGASHGKGGGVSRSNTFTHGKRSLPGVSDTPGPGAYVV